MTTAVIVPTRARARYLRRALASIAAQRPDELLVVLDGPDADSEAVARAAGAAVVAHDRPLGLNAARNTGLAATRGALCVFVDDDVEVRPGWLEALREAAVGEPEVDVFTGPIHARFEDHPFRACGREGPPITALDLGPVDRDAPHAWGANMTVRRTAFDRVGPFDPDRELYGDEQELQDRVRASERPRIRYVAGAALDHRRLGEDARLRSLMAAARARGRASRRYDVFKRRAPSLAAETRTLLATAAHGPRFACMSGPVMAAHSLGRLEAMLGPGARPGGTASPDFLSGTSGTVGGRRGALRRVADRALDVAAPRGTVAAARRRVLVVSVVRERHAAVWAAARAELERSSHDVELRTAAPGERGKFANVDALLGAGPPDADWLLLVDDDVVLPTAFLDRFLGLAERAGLTLAQPAHRLHSHAAWSVTRRRPHSRVRETAFVEIGPVTAIHRCAFAGLLPFGDVGMGWGLDVHWAAVARERGWRIGVVDATPILHAEAPAGDAYSRETAIAQARALLADRPYLARDEANRTLRKLV